MYLDSSTGAKLIGAGAKVEAAAKPWWEEKYFWFLQMHAWYFQQVMASWKFHLLLCYFNSQHGGLNPFCRRKKAALGNYWQHNQHL